MGELEDLRAQNEELKRLLRNALDLLEKTKTVLAKKQQSMAVAAAPRRRASAPTAKKSPRVKKPRRS